MLDITKCTGENCSLKDKCWRYLAPASDQWQSWFTPEPDKTGDNCTLFWDVAKVKDTKATKD